MQTADAEDVTQLTLLRLAKAMRSFDYNPQLSFRAWLRTVTQHVWQDFIRNRKRVQQAGSTDHLQLFTLTAEKEFTLSIESAYEEELLKKSLESVRLRVHPQTWEAFRMTTLEQLSTQETANRLGMKLSLVYKAKSNVMKLLQDEVLYLEDSLR